LIRYPAYISLLASTAEKNLDAQEMRTALRLAHVKTFAGDPLVADFYREVDKKFKDVLAILDNELPTDKMQRDAIMRIEMHKLDGIIQKFSPDYADAFMHSLRIYKQQVLKAHQNVLEYFLIPVPIKSLTG
jgi:hypothetical protein